jgi:hypothetical protein
VHEKNKIKYWNSIILHYELFLRNLEGSDEEIIISTNGLNQAATIRGDLYN